MQELTPSQTVGPFFGFALLYPEGPNVAPAGDLRIEGRVYDGADDPVPDAMIEVWQPGPTGEFPRTAGGADAGNSGGHHAGGSRFRGWGRCGTDPAGRFAFRTVKPGSPEAGVAPHIGVLVHARGLLHHLMTRIYFPDEHDANAADPVLAQIPEERRASLIAKVDGDVLRFDIHLQGEHETVFFDA